MTPKNITLTKEQFNESVAELKKRYSLSTKYIFINGDTGELCGNYNNYQVAIYDANINKDYDAMMLWKYWQEGCDKLTYSKYTKLLKAIRKEWYAPRKSIWG